GRDAELRFERLHELGQLEHADAFDVINYLLLRHFGHRFVSLFSLALGPHPHRLCLRDLWSLGLACYDCPLGAAILSLRALPSGFHDFHAGAPAPASVPSRLRRSVLLLTTVRLERLCRSRAQRLSTPRLSSSPPAPARS